MDDPKDATPPTSAGGKPPGSGAAEPLSADVSRAGDPNPPAAGAGKPAAAPTATSARPAAPPTEHARVVAPPSGPPDPAPPPDVTLPAFIASLQTTLPGNIEHISYWLGDWTLIVPAGRLLEVARHLRDAADAAFDHCSDVTATDWPPRAKRFDVVYALYSTRLRHRVRLKVRAAEGEPVPSVTGVWPSANWLEREVFDLFGITFEGHPDLRRILMPDDWQGHPQRKDYPLEGPGEMLLENPVDWLRLRHTMTNDE